MVLGDGEAAIGWLQRGYERHAWSMIVIGTDWLPFVEALDDHSRYSDLMRRIDFPG